MKLTENRRKVFFILNDFFVISIAIYSAYLLRFDFLISEDYYLGGYISVGILFIIRFLLFSIQKIYYLSWRHFGFYDAINLIVMIVFSTLIFTIIVYILTAYTNIVIPRSIIAIEFFISLFLMLIVRSSKRIYLEKTFKTKNSAKDTIIIAKIDQANNILRYITTKESDYYPIAIVDESCLENTKLQGVDVYHLEELINKHIICETIIIDASIKLSTLYEKLTTTQFKEIKIATQYGIGEATLKDISVEDLLARHPKDLDKKQIEDFIKNKKVLITGAGGSIGSEISRKCFEFGASELILLDHSEFNLYKLADELDTKKVKLIMQSVTAKEFLEKTFKQYRPDIVIHAAAYKHVPLVEDNIEEAIVNNIIGTKNTIDCSIKYGVKKFVLISTDKAVRPTNVMGATKRICELYAQNVKLENNLYNSKTEIVAVRFGNVLGSSGSVIPKFKSQLEKGQNITVTHPEITRYFMLIPEACELVLQAGSLGKGGEIFILDMGDPIKILDLAKKMIELSGRDNIKIQFTGLRAGEKLYEELLIDESEDSTIYDSITIAGNTRYDIDSLNRDIEELLYTDKKLEKLKVIVPEFEHRQNSD